MQTGGTPIHAKCTNTPEKKKNFNLPIFDSIVPIFNAQNVSVSDCVGLGWKNKMMRLKQRLRKILRKSYNQCLFEKRFALKPAVVKNSFKLLTATDSTYHLVPKICRGDTTDPIVDPCSPKIVASYSASSIRLLFQKCST